MFMSIAFGLRTPEHDREDVGMSEKHAFCARVCVNCISQEGSLQCWMADEPAYAFSMGLAFERQMWPILVVFRFPLFQLSSQVFLSV